MSRVSDLAARRAWRSPRRRCRWRCRPRRWRVSATAPPIWISTIGARPRGGSFLATERKLTQATAHANPEVAGLARLNLARFYLANGFAAEALGLLNLVQQNDPSLTGDAQLVTMRAAADYMMGRYRDAHNDLGSPRLRCRPPCRAVARLDRSRARRLEGRPRPSGTGRARCLNRYPDAWQARRHPGRCGGHAGHGTAGPGRRRAPAHAQDARRPARRWQAELDQARLMAAESRYADAASHFTAVEKSGDEKLAAQAIFYHTSAALNAGAITASQAIEELEKLRFRWRGDSLELRPCASWPRSISAAASGATASRPCASRPRISAARMPRASPRTICAAPL